MSEVALDRRQTAEGSPAPGGDGWRTGRASAVRITKVGLWLALLTLVLSVAAANTGNNSLYLVIAALGALIVVAWWAARTNTRGLELAVAAPEEIYAGSPSRLRYRVRRRAPGSSTDLLLLIDGSRAGSLLRRLDGPPRWRLPEGLRRSDSVGGREPDPVRTGQVLDGEQEVLFLRRGLHRVGRARALSIFPMGLYRRQVTFSSCGEVIVYPEIFPGLRVRRSRAPRGWRESGPRTGRSGDLHSLRSFRSGDDPRSIHWKQSARNRDLIFQQRSEDEARRISLLVDSYVPRRDERVEARFERLVSEAATSCVEYLDRGYEVELILREGGIGFDSGPWQRRRVLEALALLSCQTSDGSDHLVASEPTSRELRFSLAQEAPSDAPGAAFGVGS